MAAVDTAQPGEDDNETSSIQDWMEENGFNLRQDTYATLQEEGFETTDHLKRIKSTEIMEFFKGIGIKSVDRFALREAREKLESPEKKNFVDPEEIKIIKSIDLKIKTFQNNINEIISKEKNINNEKKKEYNN
eukprot:47083_1